MSPVQPPGWIGRTQSEGVLRHTRRLPRTDGIDREISFGATAAIGPRNFTGTPEGRFAQLTALPCERGFYRDFGRTSHQLATLFAFTETSEGQLVKWLPLFACPKKMSLGAFASSTVGEEVHRGSRAQPPLPFEIVKTSAYARKFASGVGRRTYL